MTDKTAEELIEDAFRGIDFSDEYDIGGLMHTLEGTLEAYAAKRIAEDREKLHEAMKPHRVLDEDQPFMVFLPYADYVEIFGETNE